MSRHEAPEVEAMVRRMFRALVRRAAEGDWEALEALGRLEGVAAGSATEGLYRSWQGQGGRYSFGELAQVVGTSRQAVRQRVARRDQVNPGLLEFLGR